MGDADGDSVRADLMHFEGVAPDKMNSAWMKRAALGTLISPSEVSKGLAELEVRKLVVQYSVAP